MTQLRFFDPKHPNEVKKMNARRNLVLELNRHNELLNTQKIQKSIQDRKHKARLSFSRKKLHRLKKMRAHKKQVLHQFLHGMPLSLNSEHDLIKLKPLNYNPHFFQSLLTKKTLQTQEEAPATIQKIGNMPIKFWEYNLL
ncbi:hypothetical protein [Legionella waltersii]|uniref:Uncharacterized protein n=1 Tax=Legionella waltersii TaxID=66969 RepID=A0A0W1AAJ9_9GAMM|nr:hypothetical protein [Legionella waltersii]KTD78311.1 hypothetical protein Lwal_1746 [Legionella waltersii]SNV08772.1 Uncharacterised protein [Legionella waltersii]